MLFLTIGALFNRVLSFELSRIRYLAKGDELCTGPAVR